MRGREKNRGNTGYAAPESPVPERAVSKNLRCPPPPPGPTKDSFMDQSPAGVLVEVSLSVGAGLSSSNSLRFFSNGSTVHEAT